MSWEAWADQMMVPDKDGNSSSSSAGIFGFDSCTFGVSTNGSPMTFTAEAAADVLSMMNNPTGAPKRVKINDVEYLTLRFTDDEVRLKLKGQGGATIAKAKTFFVIGVYSEGMQAGSNAKAVLDVRDILNAQMCEVHH